MVDIDLATCAAGPRLATLLDRLDVTQLDAEQVLAYVAAVRRQQAWTDAQLIQATARFVAARQAGSTEAGEEGLVRLGGAGSPPCATRAPDELGPDLRMSRRCTQRLIADSLDLTYRLSDVWIALRLGLIDTWRARMVAEATRDLTAEAAGAVGKEVLGRVNRLGRGEIRRSVDRIATGTEPPRDSAAEQ